MEACEWVGFFGYRLGCFLFLIFFFFGRSFNVLDFVDWASGSVRVLDWSLHSGYGHVLEAYASIDPGVRYWLVVIDRLARAYVLCLVECADC